MSALQQAVGTSTGIGTGTGTATGAGSGTGTSINTSIGLGTGLGKGTGIGIGTGVDSYQLIKRDRSMLTMSGDSVMLRQILETHAPDGHEVDVKRLLRIVDDILNRATLQVVDTTPNSTTQAQADIEDEARLVMMDELGVIKRIAAEIAHKSLGGSDAHQTTLSIFSMLASYPWDAKLVLTLAAFALTYGEFWLLVQIHSTNQLAKSITLLKQIPSILEHTGPFKSLFDALNKLIRAIMDVANRVVEFKELPSPYISQEVPAMSSAMALIPAAVYWTIRSVVASAAQIASLTSMGHDFALTSPTEALELSTLAHKLTTIHEYLRKQLALCYNHIDERRDVETFRMLVELFETAHIDNMKVLKALIHAKDDILPLVDGSTKKRVSIDVLRRRNVLLLISGLNISQDELAILEQIYNESRIHATRLDSQYEVVWIPIVVRSTSAQWTDAMQKQFDALQSTMPWYTVASPLLIEKPVIRFIKEVWHFRNKPILVVLDPQGKVVSPNAIHMMWIWGSNAFPFTSLREEALWRDETWRLELLVDGIDPTVLTWMREDKYIFLYGGDDAEWVTKFTNSARAVALAARIPLEMVYVGKSTKREQVRRVIATITVEKLSYYWQDLTMIWFFWTRLQSMLFPKIQLGKADDVDPMMQEIKKLLSHDREGGWAVLCKGPHIVVNGHGTTVLPTLLEYDMWKEQIPVKGFDLSFKDHHDKLHGIAHPCCRFEFPFSTSRIPENMKCPECSCTMEKYSTFLCCHDEGNVDPDAVTFMLQ